ncbi:hypothetical protein [Leptospira levettii]|uniref:hypothetical protein n=1 Tax=Leptospira levettii TaxID=2023178 RepID=UPI00223D27EA|nr:hypothetical protein [Leptospira levettii]MCW7475596.1 hypothetical protein [Leptospira levettii]
MNKHFDLIKHEFEGLTTICEMNEIYYAFQISNQKTMKDFILKFYLQDSFFALIIDNSKYKHDPIPLDKIFKTKGIPIKNDKFWRKFKGNVFEEIAKYYIGNLVACKEYL